MGTLGLGNGATFQLVGLRFRARIGVVTGLVGAAGGLGGFLLPIALGSLHDRFGGYGAGLTLAAFVVAVAFVGVGRPARRPGAAAGARPPKRPCDGQDRVPILRRRLRARRGGSRRAPACRARR